MQTHTHKKMYRYADTYTYIYKFATQMHILIHTNTRTRLQTHTYTHTHIHTHKPIHMRSYLNACIERSEYWFLLSSSTCCMYTDACTLFVSLLCVCVCVCACVCVRVGLCSGEDKRKSWSGQLTHNFDR